MLCHGGVPAVFQGEFAECLDDGELVEAVDAYPGPVSVLIPSTRARLVSQLLSLSSWRCGQLFIEGTGREEARRELETIDWLSWVRVRYVDFEYVPPRLIEEGPGYGRLIGGLGVVEIAATVSDHHARRESATPMVRLIPRYQSAFVPPRIAAQQLALEIERRERADRLAQDLMASASWRITAPLRRLKRMRR